MARIIVSVFLVFMLCVPLVVQGADLVNINTATETELIKLPGIGNATAKRIIDFREKNGSFNQTEDLLKVKGIGRKKLEKIKALITVQK